MLSMNETTLRYKREETEEDKRADSREEIDYDKRGAKN